MGRATGKIVGIEVESETAKFAREVHGAVVAKSARLLIGRLSGKSFAADDPLVDAVTSDRKRIGDLLVSFRPDIPIVAVGGPAAVFYPDVGKRLGAEVIIPEGSEVANAIGAAIGMIKVHAVVEITSSEKGGYLIHHEGDPEHCDNGPRAIARAEVLARAVARRESRVMGGSDVEIDVSIDRIDIPDLAEELSLVAATVTAEVVSAPDGD